MSCYRQLIFPVICLPGCSSMSRLCGSLWFHCLPFLVRGCLQGWMTSKCHVYDNSLGVTSVWYWWGQACRQHPSLRPNDLPRRRLSFFPGLAVLVWVSRGPEVFGPEVRSWLLGFLSLLFPTVSQSLQGWQRMSFRTWKLFETAVSVSRHCADCIMLQVFQRKHFFQSEIAESQDICLL